MIIDENNTGINPENNEDVQTQTNQNDTVDNNQQDTVTDTNTNQDKTFTQEELNGIIAKRLEKYKDYNELKDYHSSAEEAKLTELEKLQNKIDALAPLEQEIKSANKTLEKVLDKQLESIDEEKRGLIPKSFSVNQKLDYISKNSDYLMNGKVNIKTPTENSNTYQGNINMLYGKYSSVTDFAQKDPAEFKRVSTTNAYIEELNRFNQAKD